FGFDATYDEPPETVTSTTEVTDSIANAKTLENSEINTESSSETIKMSEEKKQKNLKNKKKNAKKEK
ncbi:MAG: hypothetical protein L0L39_05085, partial [Atopostipes suicloacalis]|nr:hypothetical protein [Atopostipes suicloacalis]